ncbi:MAG: hypothetical protein SVR94_18035 [Pseudomonadota bacterium]|nr:hypothetical protein [Pseudomonadota bacterium]
MDNLFSKANEIYMCSRDFTIEYHNLEYSELNNYSKSISKLFNALGETKGDDYWKERKSKLKRIPFLFSVAPLTKSFLKKELVSAIRYFEQDLDNCESLYPSYSALYRISQEAMKKLSDTDLDVIKIYVDEILISKKSSVVILIKDTKLIPFVEDTYPNIQIDSINSLRNNSTYSSLIVIGPPSWFPDYIFSSPRANSIHIIKYSWIRDYWEPRNVFPKSIVSENRKFDSIKEDTHNDNFYYIEPDLFLPKIDFSSIIQSTWEQADEDSEAELVEAIIGHLENDQIVFLDFDDSSSIRIIDVEDGNTLIKNIRVKELAPEMFLLLKTSGGGDYIVPLANRILGDQSSELRNLQKYWKNLLRDKVKVLGMDKVISELRARGCSIASHYNVRNWISYRSIKTRSFSDFEAIMNLINLESKATDIWEKMRVIDTAHKQAGKHITKLLLNIAKKADLDKLMRLGIMEFELPDKDAGSITAFRVKALSDRKNTVLVPYTKIGIPLDIE